MHCNSAWLKRVSFLEGTEPEFIAALVSSLPLSLRAAHH
jgi:hypothetical protein